MALLADIQPWHWLALGFALLVAEVFTGTTYLLWPAAAAAITALLAWLAPFGALAQLGAFAVLTIALTIAGRRLLPAPWLHREAAATLNERAASLAGQIGVAETAFAAGAGRVRLGDSVWRGASDEPIAAGDQVLILAVNGSTLHVKRAG